MKAVAALTAAMSLVSGAQEEWVRLNAPAILRELDALRAALPPNDFRLGAMQELADDLQEMHDSHDYSLDAWVSAREYVEAYHGPITENGA